MKTFRKMLSILLSVLLVLPLFSELKAVKADAVFFIPDDTLLRQTASLDIEANPGSLVRDNVPISNNGRLNITGTVNGISSQDLYATAELLSYAGDEGWVVQPGRTVNTKMLVNENRFEANLQLFPGFNRITLYGEQGGVKKPDVFYILYESGITVSPFQMHDGSSVVDVNQNSRVVATNKVVYFSGKAPNATEQSVNGNRGQILSSDGSFHSASVTLNPGLNKINFEFSNSSDRLNFVVEVYYYDPQSPFLKLDVKQDGEDYEDLLNNSNVTFTGPVTSTTGSAQVELLLPYKADSFADKHIVRLSNGRGARTIYSPNASHQSLNNIQETIIYNNNYQPTYRLVSFEIPSYKLRETTAGTLDPDQTFALEVEYGTGTQKSTATISRNFKITTDEILLKNAYLLTTYNGTETVDEKTPKKPLNGSQVDKPEFYILVETSKAPTPTGKLEIQFEPLGTLTLTEASGDIERLGVANSNGTPDNKQVIFRVKNFPEGTQSAILKYSDKDSILRAKITFVNKVDVLIESLTNSQIIERNSSELMAPVLLKGQFVGFGEGFQPQLLINNTDYTTELNTSLNGSAQFNMELDFTAHGGPLHIGENTIKFIVRYYIGNEQIVRTLTKELKIYIMDKNTPDISTIRPLTPPVRGLRGELSSSKKTDYLPHSPEFVTSGSLPNTYTTTLKSFDFFLEGSGKGEVTIKKSGVPIISFTPGPDIQTGTITQNSDPLGITNNTNVNLPNGVSMDYHGQQAGFRIRINDLPIENLGIHAFSVEFRGGSLTPVTARMDIDRITAPYRILAPKANVNDKIVVNKNFVLFDIEAEGATEVIVDGVVAEQRKDFPSRFMATVSKLKVNKENKIKFTVKRDSGDLSGTVNVYYAGDVGVDSMFMEKMSNKHTVFDKKLELTFPKNTVLRRTTDNKIYPDNTILFGIASPVDGVVGRVNDYGDILGFSPDQANQNHNSDGTHPVTFIPTELAQYFTNRWGMEHFTTVSPFYWVSAGYAERGNPGDGNYEKATGGLPPYNFIQTFSTYQPDPNFLPDERKLLPSNRGTLKIAYDPNVVVDAGSYLTVFYLNDKREWKNIGGVTDPKSKTITVPFEDFGYYTVAKLRYSYYDIVGHGWARNILSALYAKGIMDGLLPEEFGTDVNITRAEFAVLLVRAMDLPLNYDNNNTFYDVQPGSRTKIWTYEEIETAARAGIVYGNADKGFDPGNAISRQEAASMIARALSLKVQPIDDKLIAKLNKTFTDGPDIGRYAKPAVDAVYSNKLMTGSPAGSDNKKELIFRPGAPLTRAEAGQIVVNILKKYNKKFAKELS